MSPSDIRQLLEFQARSHTDFGAQYRAHWRSDECRIPEPGERYWMRGVRLGVAVPVRRVDHRRRGSDERLAETR